MNMPTPCPRCGEVVEFNHMTNIGQELYCEECAYELENQDEESNW